MKWRPPDRDDRRVAALWAVCAVSAVILRPVWIAAAGLLAPCPWHAWTGWPCPGCGTTRAILRLLDADLTGAFAVNPLSASGAAAFIVGGLAAPVWLRCGGRAPSLDVRPRAIVGALLAGLFFLNWAWLAIAGV